MSTLTTQAPITTSQSDAGKHAVTKAVAAVSHLATLPQVTLRIVKLVEDPNSSAADMHKIISHDPALCARVLKVVNSAFYGLPGQIGSINRAIVLLGLNAVKNIAVATSLGKLFQGGRMCPTFCAADLWKHSLAVGTTARLLAEKAHLNVPDEAFLAGLIHDIGVIVELQADRTRFMEVIERKDAEGLTFLEAEELVLGANHQEFGSALCEKWKFPTCFAHVTGSHHDPLAAEADSRALTCLVHVADVTAARLGLGYSGTVASHELDPSVLDELRLTANLVDEVVEQAPRAFEVAEQTMN